MRRFTLFVLTLAASASVSLAQDVPIAVRGLVRGAMGAPIDQANVFLLETLDGALTDSVGRFTIHSTHRGAATLVVRRVGFREIRVPVVVPMDSALTLTMGIGA